MSDPYHKTLHRAGLASDGWDRFRDVLVEYLAGGAPSGTSTGDLISLPPSSPDSWNSEFLEGDDDIAAHGWLVYTQEATPTLCTWLGPVNSQVNPRTGMALRTYRSSIRNGRMLFQAGGAQPLVIVKPVSGTFVATAKVTNVYMAGSGNDQIMGLVLIDNLTVPIGTAGQNAIVNDVLDSTYRLVSRQGATATIEFSGSNIADIHAGSIFYTGWQNSGALVNAYQMNGTSGVIRMFLPNYAMTGTYTPSYAGLYLKSGFGAPPSYFIIDWMRRYPLNTWYPI